MPLTSASYYSSSIQVRVILLPTHQQILQWNPPKVKRIQISRRVPWNGYVIRLGDPHWLASPTRFVSRLAIGSLAKQYVIGRPIVKSDSSRVPFCCGNDWTMWLMSRRRSSLWKRDWGKREEEEGGEKRRGRTQSFFKGASISFFLLLFLASFVFLHCRSVAAYWKDIIKYYLLIIYFSNGDMNKTHKKTT